ncbi:hypothetical protein AHMF7616_03016 [Adhaeribacter pallidiroseus]|uniref:Uncharacterized protein n=1 Tax=Adhaeribacter pallidiroseus TaxID=2072847 RepID=A0A369QJ26_9BACT|nr:hypothetical protein AHMF7616_03016 [Adhaeribacter pallidiroseus]
MLYSKRMQDYLVQLPLKNPKSILAKVLSSLPTLLNQFLSSFNKLNCIKSLLAFLEGQSFFGQFLNLG